ncbi:MAG: hypothetical protein HY725_21700 [Candidatus Rokubacteria bacterium]|nr:hypothetical protein [Candidatus Rokubacteria bacterium]
MSATAIEQANKADSPECVFCGQAADTREHVVPSWLQEHFALPNQRLLLWNGTTMPYRQAVVPACLRCNRDRFSPLEKRIRERRATKRDYFLWALKIMYGLAQRDATLHIDRANPGAGPLLPRALADDIGPLARHAFRALDSSDFRLSPDPFGSVMRIASGRDDFMLIDVPRPYRAVAVALPDNRHLVVLPGDRGVIAAMYKKNRPMKNSLILELPKIDGQLQLAMKLFGMLILRSHLDIPREIYLEDGGLCAAAVPRRLRTIRQPREVYHAIATMLHLPQIVADHAYDQYAPAYTAAGTVRWR